MVKMVIILGVLLLAGCSAKGVIPGKDPDVKNGAADGSVSACGQLYVKEGRLVDEKGEPFQLRGMSSHGLCWYPEYINAGAIKAVKEAGGNVFRAAMYTEPQGGYLSDPEKNTRLVIEAIENAKAMDMYVIADWHILDDGDPNVHLEEAITFFDRIASFYAGDPAVIYEICNEPNGVGWDEIKAYAYAMIHVIRQYSPDAIIIVGTPSYSSDLAGPLTSPVEAEGLLYAYHYYAGEHDDFKGLRKAEESGLPVFVSEWGVGRKRGQPALSEAREFIDWMNEKGISWCAWSLCNKDETYSALKPECTALSGFAEEDLTESGSLYFKGMKGSGGQM